MTIPRPLLWLALGGIVLAVGWLLVEPNVGRAEWEITAESPRVVGDALDAFAYAGGDPVRPVAGSATARVSPGDAEGIVRVTVESDEPAAPLSLRDSTVAGRSWELLARIDDSSDFWIDTSIGGDTGLGEGRLPETAVRIAGQARFDLIVDGNRRRIGLSGLWSVADAVRRDDGSIRQRGLIFTPLLRDQSGFSDPSRLELTLLLYKDGPGSNVLLHLVFFDVTIERSPADPSPPPN